MGSKILLFVTKHLLIIHKGTIAAKLKSSITLAVSASPFAMLVEKMKHWAVDNIEFMTIIQLGNVVCKELFNDALILHKGTQFGNPDETISSVLGKNKKADIF